MLPVSQVSLWREAWGQCAPQFIRWRLNIQDLRISLYEEVESLKRLNETTRVDPNPMWLVSIKKLSKVGRTHRGKTMWRHREKIAIYKPRSAISEESMLLTPWSQSSSLYICEKINSCLSFPVSGTLLWQLLQTIRGAISIQEGEGLRHPGE